MKERAATPLLSVSILVLMISLAAPADAQWCTTVCAPENNPGLGYPMCNVPCNNGGGDYTNCGGAGYECCTQGIQNYQMLGQWSTPIVQGLICDLTIVWERRAITVCPDQVHYSGTWCEAVDDGWFFTLGQSCCEAGPCWGQQYC
jgi:hypothetical protein